MTIKGFCSFVVSGMPYSVCMYQELFFFCFVTTIIMHYDAKFGTRECVLVGEGVKRARNCVRIDTLSEHVGEADKR